MIRAPNFKRRFTLKRTQVRKNGWLPLVLQWRRRRRQPVRGVKAASTTHYAPVFCFPQIHWHFATLQSFVPRIVSSMRTIERERFVLDRNWSRIVTLNNSLQTLHPNPSLLITHTRDVSQQESVFQKTVQRSSSQNVTAHRENNFFTTTGRVNTVTQTFKTHRHTQEHQRFASSLLFASSKTFVFAGTTQKQTEQIFFDRGEELLWRSAQPRTPVSENVPGANIAETTNEQPVRTSVAQTNATSAATASATATPQQITKLDPHLVDRLTEDVIRRVEKRALIERQRRGL